MKSQINLSKLKINNIEYTNSKVNVFAEIKSKQSKCPDCGKYSKKVHDHYYRTVSDLPVWQARSIIILKTRKFKCKNSKCKRIVFSEQTPHISRYSRRTNRVNDLIDSLSIELTGNLGCLMAKQFLIPVSISTITRIAHSQLLPKIEQPTVLGVDDWAYRKGISYGTILIDMEKSTPIDILESRDGKDLKEWLSKYPDVKIVTRDRASSYSSAVNEICPDAIQIADRFHLFMNLSDALDKYFKSISPQIRLIIKDKSNDIRQDQCNKESLINPSLKAPQVPIAIKLDQRLQKFNKVKELQARKIPIKRIARELGMGRGTVRSYFEQETLLPKQHSKSTNIEAYTSYIVSMLQIEGHKVQDIIEKITKLGYNGGKTQAFVNIKKMKENFDIHTNGITQFPFPDISYVKPLTTRKLAKYIDLSLNQIIDQDERKYLKTLLHNMPELQIVKKLVLIFKTMFKRKCGNIRRWIDFIKHSKYKLTGLKSFANGLLQDIRAVKNGITMTWSNGPVEGHVNRIKSIKRKMYGRASFDLLRKKVILSQTG